MCRFFGCYNFSDELNVFVFLVSKTNPQKTFTGVVHLVFFLFLKRVKKREIENIRKYTLFGLFKTLYIVYGYNIMVKVFGLCY